MAEAGSVQVSVSLGLKQLISDAQNASRFLQERLKDVEIGAKINTQQAQKSVQELEQAILRATAKAADPQQAAELDRLNKLLTEQIRYKEQLAQIEANIVDPDDLARAKQLASTLNQINLNKIEQEFQEVNTAIDKTLQNAKQNIQELQAQTLKAEAGITTNKGRSAQLSKEASLLQEQIRYARQLEQIEVSITDPDDIAKAKELAATLNRINVKRIEQEFDGAKNSVQGFGSIAQGVLQGVGQSAFFALTNAIQSTVGSLQQFVSASLSAAIEIDKINNKLLLATGSTKDAAEAYDFVRKVASQTGIDAKVAAQSFADLAISAKGTAIAGDNARQLFTGLSQAFAANSLSADQQSGAFLALQQIISKGTVSAEELRGQLGERLPGAFQIAARSMNVTTAELGKLLETGSLTADEFIPKFAAQLQKEFGSANFDTPIASINALNSSIFDLQVALGKAIQPAQLAILETTSEVLQKAGSQSEALEILGDAAQRFADSLKDNPELVENLASALAQLSETLASGVAAGLDAITSTLENNPQAITQFGDAINTALSATVQLIEFTLNAVQLLSPALLALFKGAQAPLESTNTSLTILNQLFQQIQQTVSPLVSTLDGIISKLEFLKNAKPFLNAIPGGQVLASLIDALPSKLDAASAAAQRLSNALPGVGGGLAVPAAAPAATPAPAPAAAKTDYEAENQKLENAYKQRQAEIAQAVAEGNATEAQGRQQNFEAEKKYLEDRVALNEKKLEELKTAQAATTDKGKLEKIQKDILATESAIQDDRLKIAQAGAKNREQAANDAEAAEKKAAEARKKILEDVARANEQAEAVLKQSQNDRIAAVREAQLQGVIGEEQAQAEITQIQQDGINEQLDNEYDKLDQIQNLRDRGVLSAEDAAQQQQAALNSISQLNLQNIEAEIEAQERAKQAALDKFEAERKSADTAFQNRTLEVRTAQATGKIDDDQANALLIRAEQERADETVRIKEQEIQEIQNLEAQGVLTAEESAKAQEDLQKELTDARISAAEQAIKAEEQAQQQRVDAIEEEMKLRQQAAQTQQGYLKLATDALSRQNTLLSAQSNLISAQGALYQQRLQFALDAANADGNSARAEQLRRDAIANQIKQREAQFKIEQAQLALKYQQNRLELESEKINARIALLESAAQFRTAQINGASEAELNNLRQIVQLRGDQLNTLGAQEQTLSRSQQLERQTLDAQQQTDLEGLREQQRREQRTNEAITEADAAGYRAPGALTGNFSANTNASGGLASQFNADQFLRSAIPADSALRDGGLAAAGAGNTQLAQAFTTGNQAVVTEIQGLKAAIFQLASSPRSLTVQAPDPIKDMGNLLGTISAQKLKGAKL